MPIGRRDVETAARLARLRLDDDELTELAAELSRIIDYVSMLGDVAGGADELVLVPADVVRPDEPGGALARDEALANAPRSVDGCYAVPSFLPDGDETGGADR